MIELVKMARYFEKYTSAFSKKDCFKVIVTESSDDVNDSKSFCFSHDFNYVEKIEYKTYSKTNEIESMVCLSKCF